MGSATDDLITKYNNFAKAEVGLRLIIKLAHSDDAARSEERTSPAWEYDGPPLQDPSEMKSLAREGAGAGLYRWMLRQNGQYAAGGTFRVERE